MPIAVTAVLAGQLDDRPRQGILVVSYDQPTALRRSWLVQHPAGPPLRDSQLGLYVANRLAASFGA